MEMSKHGMSTIEHTSLAIASATHALQNNMDYIRAFDIRLEKTVYYAGESIRGIVCLDNIENLKIRGVRVILRGKAHAEWKIMKSGERRTVKDDQYLLDDKAVLWGKDKHDEESGIPILPRGCHEFKFAFQLPQSALPCSFESKAGTIRYYIKVVIDIPYASPPQGIKYFTVIGPHIDVMDEKYLTPMASHDRKTDLCLCCKRGPLALRVILERTAYVCGEKLRMHAEIENRKDSPAAVKLKLVQFVEYYIDKGVLGVSKSVVHTVLEHRSPQLAPNSAGRYDTTLEQPVRMPVLPPTLIGVCRLIQIYYVLKVSLESEKVGEQLQMDFPLTVATVPFRIPNNQQQPLVEYEQCSSSVEGGLYVSPEFQLGQVYDGDLGQEESVVLYRPVYVRVASPVDTEKSIFDGAQLTGRKSEVGDMPLSSGGSVALSETKSTLAIEEHAINISMPLSSGGSVALSETKSTLAIEEHAISISMPSHSVSQPQQLSHSVANL